MGTFNCTNTCDAVVWPLFALVCMAILLVIASIIIYFHWLVAGVNILLVEGVVTSTGHRYVLGIPEGANATIETGVFCAKYGIKEEEECEKVILSSIVTCFARFEERYFAILLKH
jgi:hypothetical protein